VHPVAAVTVIGPIIGRFSTAYPEISLDISVEAECRDIVGEQGESIAQDMIALPIGGPFRFTPVVSPDYLAKKPAPSTPETLREHNCFKYRVSADG
jgi:DNA-binding transcriptional LysR family regulator